MEAKINDNELKLLVWLHEHSRGFAPGGGFYAEAVLKGVELEPASLVHAATYLEGHGLVGVNSEDVSSYSSPDPQLMIGQLWLTSFGENYIRNIEDAPSVARKLTTAVLSSIGGSVKTVATSVLTEIIKQHLQPIKP